jgi:anaphase-promoting complex subunit 1
MAADLADQSKSSSGSSGTAGTSGRPSSSSATSGGRGPGLTRNWIVFHRPDAPSYTHAGLLMALGLAGHLTKLSWTDLYR